jgi:hypothetical protein
MFDISVKVLVQQGCQIFGLQPLRDRGEVLDVGEEDRELLAFGRDGDVLLPLKMPL